MLRRAVIKSVQWKASTRTISVASDVVQDQRVKSLEEIPGPSRLPIIGQLAHFLPGGSLHKRTNMWDDLIQRYGPIVQLNLPFNPPTVALYDADATEQILRKENVLPLRPGLEAFRYYRENYSKIKSRKMKPESLSTSSGENWKYLRSISAPVVLKPENMTEYIDKVDSVALDMVKRLSFFRGKNNMVPNFNQEMKLWSLESNAAIITGRRMNCLDLLKKANEDSFQDKIIKATYEVMNLVGELDQNPTWKYFHTKKFKKTMHLFLDVELAAEHIIAVARNDLKNSNKTEDANNILLKLLEKDEDVARIILHDLLFGGIHSLASALSMPLYLLAKNPEVQQKLRLKLTTSESRRYLRACIKEAMRLMPVNPLGSRITTREYDILGYMIPQNTIVVFCYEQMGLSEKYYHRPTEYLPERWLLNDKDDPLYFRNAHPFANSLIQLGFGVRSCIGSRMVMLQLETLLSRLIENFSIEWQGPPPKIQRGIINFLDTHNFILKDV